MQNIKGWITCLRPFSPRTISLSDSHTLIRNIATIAENTAFQKDTLYIGALMNAAYRFRTAEEISFVLIDDPKYYLDRRLCGNNTVIILEEGTDRDKVYEACKEYIRIQESILEKRQNLLDAYLSEPSLQSLLDHTAGIIGFPLMIIDNSYRVIGSSSSQECDDPFFYCLLDGEQSTRCDTPVPTSGSRSRHKQPKEDTCNRVFFFFAEKREIHGERNAGNRPLRRSGTAEASKMHDFRENLIYHI